MGIIPENVVALSRQFKLPSFDSKFTNGASLGMSHPYLQAKQTIKLAYMFKEKEIVEFSIPSSCPEFIQLDLGNGSKKLETQIQTITIDINKKEVDITWQACQKMENMNAFSKIRTQSYEVIQS